jgi:hypothetical protein
MTSSNGVQKDDKLPKISNLEYCGVFTPYKYYWATETAISK